MSQNKPLEDRSGHSVPGPAPRLQLDIAAEALQRYLLRVQRRGAHKPPVVHQTNLPNGHQHQCLPVLPITAGTGETGTHTSCMSRMRCAAMAASAPPSFATARPVTPSASSSGRAGKASATTGSRQPSMSTTCGGRRRRERSGAVARHTDTTYALGRGSHTGFPLNSQTPQGVRQAVGDTQYTWIPGLQPPTHPSSSTGAPFRHRGANLGTAPALFQPPPHHFAVRHCRGTPSSAGQCHWRRCGGIPRRGPRLWGGGDEPEGQ